jgi:hypothetical protein
MRGERRAAVLKITLTTITCFRSNISISYTDLIKTTSSYEYIAESSELKFA